MTVVSLIFLPVLAAEEPEVSAVAAILIDRDSGRVLWEKEARRRLPIASTTKIMTALLALERGCEEDPVRVSRKAAETEGSSIWLERGEQKTLGELLYGLMLRSGNDAAVAIAEHIGGTEKDFVLMMNEEAAALGAKDTLFSNPHGLPGGIHYSTARDLGL
ncbi:MAG: D-alanyl-D-alanine carboxypeptidase, partial [Firmicutes bacterium]|nr:D-alanyl-D-alanine carboxypeptidase [Bacillota bacterium]